MREQVAVGLASVDELRRHVATLHGGVVEAMVAPPLAREIAVAFAGAIVAAQLAEFARDGRPVRTSPRYADLLTPDVARVIGLLAQGLRHGEIATELSISTRQVGRRIRTAVTRTGVDNVQQLVAATVAQATSPLSDPGRPGQDDREVGEIWIRVGATVGDRSRRDHHERLPVPTKRQREVLVALCRPQFGTPDHAVAPPSNAEIALMLTPPIGAARVSDIVSGLYRSCDLSGTSAQNRVSLVGYALSRGLVGPDDY